MPTTKRPTARRALTAAAAVIVFAASACGDDDAGGDSLLGGGSGGGLAGDDQSSADLPEDLSELSGEEPADPSSDGTGHGDDPNDDGTTDQPTEPGKPPQNMCDVVSASEMSQLLGYDIATTLTADFPAEECLFDVDGEAIASIQAYYGDARTDPAAYIQKQTAEMWDYSDQLYGWGDAARYGSVSGGTHVAIAVAERRSDSVVLLFMWMKGQPNEDMLDTGAAIAEAILPRL
ncbi:hypothetical protein [Phytoactinopolyspora halotolerans]|uniref:DUF3558 domain-containing protein n=1 Tax=Phytoactinopolyspora halotolerans TaxID=1981512 RepID=A0A6L9S3W0_9ACTN|nr:hypothetical protein [Phytoactinopolyspora halotolerans]NED99718.1 hypothetical protein [Phytoactinopolyspora halotolerans]